MKLVADSRGRICSADLFPPGQAFEATPEPDGSVRVTQLRKAEVPTIELVERDGRLTFPFKVSREVIAAAVRAERDQE
jgi:hypothetical protein